MSDLIAVTGATGALGSLVIDQLLRRVPADRIVALARNPEKVAAVPQSVQVRIADHDDRAAVDAALAGIDVLLLMSGNEFGERMAQHRNVVEAAKQAGVSRIVYTSAPHADTSTAFITAEHKATEQLIRDSGLTYTMLRMNSWPENYASLLTTAPQTGSIIGSVHDGRVASAARADYAEATAVVLATPGYDNAIYELTGDTAWNYHQLAATISEVTGATVTYNDLSSPETVLTTVMRKHQRYLPVRAADGRLMPHFVAVANGSVDTDAVRAGNEAVLRARFEDPAFFDRADRATPLAEMRQRLAKLTFTDKLGSMSDRAERIAALALGLAADLRLGPDDQATLRRAAGLVKFDLGSQMVIELTSLAGTMAREYAQAAGETPAVAQALPDTELPRTAGDALPSTLPGSLLSLADRLDALVGLAATVGLPTGSSDPFAVRRACLGILAVIRAEPELGSIDLSRAVTKAAAGQPVPVAPGRSTTLDCSSLAASSNNSRMKAARPTGSVPCSSTRPGHGSGISSSANWTRSPAAGNSTRWPAPCNAHAGLCRQACGRRTTRMSSSSPPNDDSTRPSNPSARTSMDE